VRKKVHNERNGRKRRNNNNAKIEAVSILALRALRRTELYTGMSTWAYMNLLAEHSQIAMLHAGDDESRSHRKATVFGWAKPARRLLQLYRWWTQFAQIAPAT